MKELLDTHPEILVAPSYTTRPSVYNSASIGHGLVIPGGKRVYTPRIVERRRDYLYAAIEKSSSSGA